MPGNSNDRWNGGTGDWNDGANWSPSVPTSADAATIITGHPTVGTAVPAEAAVVVVAGQVSSGEASPTLTVNGTLTTAEFGITAGAIDGTGTIIATTFMQGSGSRDDEGSYSSAMNGPLNVLAASVLVGGGKDGGFTIGQGATLTATGSSTIHQGFIEGSGTLENGTQSDFGSAVMSFVSSATIDAVTFGSSPLNNDTSIGVFVNFGMAEFSGVPMPGQDDDFSAGTIVNNGIVEFESGSPSIGRESATDITGTGRIEIANAATAVIAADTTIGSGQTFFLGGGTLLLDGDAAELATSFRGQLGNNLSFGDVIELPSVGVASVSLDATGSNLIVQTTTPGVTLTFALSGILSSDAIVQVVTDSPGSSDLTVVQRPDDNWIDGAGDGQWTTRGNWSDSFNYADLPTLIDNAVIGAQFAGTQITIGQGVSAQAGTLELNGGVLLDQGTLIVGTKLDIAAGATFALDGGSLFIGTSIDVAAGAAFLLSDGGSLSLPNSGAVVIAAGGLLQGSGSVFDIVDNGGTIEATPGQTLSIQNLSGSGGVLQIDSGATLAAAAGSGFTVLFNGADGQFDYGNASANFTGPTLDGLSDGDSIAILFDVFASTPGYTLSPNAGTLAIFATSPSTTVTATFDLTNVSPGQEFLLTEGTTGVVATLTDNIPPVIAVPRSISETGSGPFSIESNSQFISISDADTTYTAITATVTLTGEGSLSMTTTGLVVGTQTPTELIVTGTQEQINADLQTLTYTPGSATTQFATITVTAQNNGPTDINANAAAPQSVTILTTPADVITALTDGDWSAGATWSSNPTVPGVTSDVVDDGHAVTISDAESARSLTVVSGGDVEVDGTLTLAAQSSIILPNDPLGDTLGLDGTIFANGSTLYLAGGSFNVGGNFSASGTLDHAVVRGDLYIVSGLNNAFLTIQNGFSIAPLSGSGPGQINVDAGLGAPVSSLNFAGTYTLKSTAVTLTGVDPYIASLSGDALTLDSSTTVLASTAVLSGTSMINYGTITATGPLAADTANLVNQGMIIVNGGTLGLYGSTFDNTGTVIVENNGYLLATAGDMIAGGGTIITQSGGTAEYAGATPHIMTATYNDPSTLIIDDPATFDATIAGFGIGDVIEIPSEVILAGTIIGTEMTLTLFGGGTQTFNVAPGQSGEEFATTPSGGLMVICFLSGTLIATPAGEVPVEQLAPGDAVLTLQGEARRIVWIGAGRVLATRGRRDAATPVIVRKGALADNVPHRDLRVTKAHSLYVDDVLIPVEFLVNHRTILWDDHAQEVALYHIELESHDVLLANGAPAESYRDDGNRWLFQNANTGWGSPPQEPYAPVLTGGPVVDAVWRRLLDRAGPRQGVPLTDDPDLHLLVDGKRVDATESWGGVHVFQVTERPGELRICSRSGAPAELGFARDPRSLGVPLRLVVLEHAGPARILGTMDLSLNDGFHGFEPDHGFRWTDGDALLPPALLDGIIGPCKLTLHIGPTSRYPLLAGDDRRAA